MRFGLWMTDVGSDEVWCCARLLVFFSHPSFWLLFDIDDQETACSGLSFAAKMHRAWCWICGMGHWRSNMYYKTSIHLEKHEDTLPIRFSPQTCAERWEAELLSGNVILRNKVRGKLH
jgi:hypothetical protein